MCVRVCKWMCVYTCVLRGRKRHQWRSAGASVWEGAGALLTSAYGDTARQQLLTSAIRTGRRLSGDIQGRQDRGRERKQRMAWWGERTKTMRGPVAACVRACVRGLLVSLYLRVCVRQAATLSSDTRTTSQNKNTAATMSSVMVAAVLRWDQEVCFTRVDNRFRTKCPSLSWEGNWCADTNGNTKVEPFLIIFLV